MIKQRLLLTSSGAKIAMAALATLIIAIGVGPSSEAQTVGVVTATNPAARGTPPGEPARTLSVGADVVFRERIVTDSAGSAQLTFLDRSTINVGTGSDVVIDDFLYKAGGGAMTVKLTKGLMRFVGGQISHEGGMTVSTPTVTVGIRGGIATIGYLTDPEEARAAGAETREPGTLVINHFGEMVVNNRGAEVRLMRPGFAVFVGAHGSMGAPFQIPPTAAHALSVRTTSRANQHGGSRIALAPIGANLPAPVIRVPQPPPLTGLALNRMVSGVSSLVRSHVQAQHANQLSTELAVRSATSIAVAPASLPSTPAPSGPAVSGSSTPMQTPPLPSSQTASGGSGSPTNPSAPASSQPVGTPVTPATPAQTPVTQPVTTPVTPATPGQTIVIQLGTTPATPVTPAQPIVIQLVIPDPILPGSTPSPSTSSGSGSSSSGHDNGQGNSYQNNGNGNGHGDRGDD